MVQRGHYPGKITTIPLSMENERREIFRAKLEALPFLAYEVEKLADGRRVCITKPGGKASFGRLKASDFMVWVYDPSNGDRWRISYGDLVEDLKMKFRANRRAFVDLFSALEQVYEGAEPDPVLATLSSSAQCLPGEPPELIFKVFKWLWGQEDCNYPSEHHQGRAMSMDGLRQLFKTPRAGL